MPISRLELIAGHGDQTLGRVRFFLYPARNATDSISAEDAGLQFSEGRAIAATNIVYAHNAVLRGATSQTEDMMIGDPGRIFIFSLPPNLHLGYGIFTSAYIDRQAKRVVGAPIRYAAAREQLALYNAPDTENARVHIESEVANGYALEQQPVFLLEPKYIIGKFLSAEGFDELVKQVAVSINSFSAVDYDRFMRAFLDVMRVSANSNPGVAETALRDLITGTVESSVISRLRTMRWQNLSLLGYSFFEGDREVKIPGVTNLGEQRSRMDELGRLLASASLFTAETEWLKQFVAKELEIMRVELEGAELESMTD